MRVRQAFGDVLAAEPYEALAAAILRGVAWEYVNRPAARAELEEWFEGGDAALYLGLCGIEADTFVQGLRRRLGC